MHRASLEVQSQTLENLAKLHSFQLDHKELLQDNKLHQGIAQERLV